MSGALTVLAECVDVRTNRRFLKGENFEPAPTIEQAKRLIAAGCLPEAAMKVAAEFGSNRITLNVAANMSATTAVLDKLRQDVEDARQAAVKEIDEINAGVDRARVDAETLLAEISANLSTARKNADAEASELEKNVADARAKADTDIKAVEAGVEKAQEAAKKSAEKKA